MAIGALIVHAKLEQPGKIHYGTGEPVECYADIKFAPKFKIDETPQELFGPLKVTAIFQGRAKVKIVVSSSNGNGGSSKTSHRSTVCLFSQSTVIWNDSWRQAAGKAHRIPFRLDFPAVDQAVLSKVWDTNPLFTSTHDSLPPSFFIETSGSSKIKAYVEYRVGLIASMPGIHVDVQTQDYKAQPSIRYEVCPPVSPEQRPMSLRGYRLLLQSAALLPEEERPRGFAQKTKALFHQDRLPRVLYSWTATTITKLQIDRPLIFDITLLQEQCTAEEPPEVQLQSINIHLKSHFTVRAEKRLFSTPQRDEDGWDFNLLAKPTDRKPFSKANNWTKRFITQPMPEATSTFSTYNINLKWRYSLSFVFDIAGKLIDRKLKTDVVITPSRPIFKASGSAATHVVASGSFQAGESSTSAAINTSLPGYAEALNDTPLPAPQYNETLSDSQLLQLEELQVSQSPPMEKI